MRVRRIISIILVIIVMILIFMFSSQNGNSSSGLSNKFTDTFIKIFIHKYDTYSLTKQQDIHDTVSLIIRKSAHMTEYGILGALLFSSTFGLKLRYRTMISLITVFLYACTDEFHQTFSQGRNGASTDVLIDFLGGVIFVAVYLFISLIKTKHNMTKKDLN